MSEVFGREIIEAGMKAFYGDDVYDLWRDRDVALMERNIKAVLRAVFFHAPDGWQLVPIEPTEAMLDAYWHQAGESKEMRPRTHASARRYYSAMLAATKASPNAL